MVAKKDEINEEILVEADQELLYEFFTDADLIARWHGVSAETDPRPGGIFHLNVTGKDYKVGEFLELDRPNRIVFTWGHPEGVDSFPPGSSVVTVTFKPVGKATLVHVNQTDFPNGHMRKAHSAGWQHYLSRLCDVVEGRDPGRDPRRKVA